MAATIIYSQPITSRSIAEAVVTAVKVTDTYIIVGLDNGEMHTFDIHGANQKPLLGATGAIWALDANQDLLASGGVECDIRTWDLTRGEQRQTLRGHTSTVRALQFLKDVTTLVSASRDTTLRVWNLQSSQCTKVLAVHTATVRRLAVSDDLLVSGSHDGTACVWSIGDNFSHLHTLSGHERVIHCVIADSNKKRIFTGGADACVRIWDAANGQCLAVLQEHGDIVIHAQIPGAKMITADSEGYICIWSLEGSPSLLHRIRAHEFSVVSLDSDTTRLVSGSSDGSVKLWDLESGRLLGKLSETAEAVWKVAKLGGNRILTLVARERRVIMEIWDITGFN